MFVNLAFFNFWNPTHVNGWVDIIVMALVLGMIHGITPDEHTWPITFSYAIGSYSTIKGLRSGIIFSLAFTLQRAIASELAYLGLARLYTVAALNNIIYVVVGILMLLAGLMIVRRKTIFHFELPFLKAHHLDANQDNEPWLNDPKPWMPALHGFVAGWGFGAFAIIIYTLLAPAAHSAYWAWVPGAVFGLGTMVMQALAGAAFGLMAAKKGLSARAIRKVALKTAGNTLTWGGVAFILAGSIEQVFPRIGRFAINTNVHVHNLDSLGVAFLLVIISVIGVGLTTLIVQTRAELGKLKLEHLD